MTSGKIFIILLLLFLALFLLDVSKVASQVPPAPPEQQRPDIFPCSFCTQDRDGDGKLTMQDYNPTSVKAKKTHSISYRVLVLSGCVSGTIPSDLQGMNVHVRDSLDGFVLNRNDQSYDFTVYISCGITHINKCGSVNVYCLPDGFPFNQDVYISDVLSTYYPASRLAILLHEIIGHAISTWNEQYAQCGSSCGFASTPGLVDFMNTGPLSRQGFEKNTLARWSRTMYVLDVHQETQQPTTFPFWDGVRWQLENKTAFQPSDASWWRLNNANQWVLEWGSCTPYGGRWNAIVTDWLKQGSEVWLGQYPGMPQVWSQIPPC